MADKGDEQRSIDSIMLDALDELSYQMREVTHMARPSANFMSEIRGVIEASVKAGRLAVGRGKELEDVYRLVLDHMLELPGKLREL